VQNIVNDRGKDKTSREGNGSCLFHSFSKVPSVQVLTKGEEIQYKNKKRKSK
jgi:hypothetical protein